MTNDTLKYAAARAALSMIEEGMILGVGSGSTINAFIDLLSEVKSKIEGAIPSSNETEKRLKACGISILSLNAAGDIPLYIDGADEFLSNGMLLKGRGGALVREKIVAAAAQKFVCMVTEDKAVDILGKNNPIPVEVLPFARSYVARTLTKKGFAPIYREGFVSDNGNHILDIFNLSVIEPHKMEQELNALPGVIDNGIFSNHRANVILVANAEGVQKLIL